MPRHHERQFLPYPPEQLKALVADVERYPDFLPWCRAARVWNRTPDGFDAELVIGFKAIRERYTSRVTIGPDTIDVEMLKGPFEHLVNHWRFEPVSGGGEIVFDLDFRFNSRLLEALIGKLYVKACERMVSAFRERADRLYGGAPAQKGDAPARPIG